MASRRYCIGLMLVVICVVLSGGTIASRAQEDAALPLAAAGPYEVGVQTVTLVDEAREDRALVTEVWYPALDSRPQTGEAGASRQAEPDPVGGPYPLVVFVHGNGGTRLDMPYLMIHLASHGYVAAALDHVEGDAHWPSLVDRPLDVLLAIDRLAAAVPDGLAAIIDGQRVGLAGFSYGGYTVIGLTGARIDPDTYRRSCALAANRRDNACQYMADWQAITAYRSQFDPLTPGDLWPATSDPRIQAVLAMAPSRRRLFGVDGLATATVPTLIMAGTADELADYRREAAFMFEHLGSVERHLLSFLDGGHFDFVTCPAVYPAVNHFATAFFGYYLRGQEDYARFLTAEAAEALDDLVWGIAPDG